jgi:uncharacterized protein YbjQ (UPF0145 family)
MEDHSPAVLDSMVTTAFTLDGYSVERNIGLVRGIIVRSHSIFGTLGASFQSMAEHAAQLEANAIVGVRCDATEIMVKPAR